MACVVPSTVNLGEAGNYVVLAETEITNVPMSAVTGDLGLYPAAATFITGFSPTLDSSGTFSTSTQVTGKLYAADYGTPTPTNLNTAVLNMGTAFVDAAGRAPCVINQGGGNLGGLTLGPGVYYWDNSVLIPANLTLSGSATDIWIMQVAQNLTQSATTSVLLTGGALAQNVFWQVSGDVDIGTGAAFEGNILCMTGITLESGASITGRLLAQSAVVLDANIIVVP
jgi:hypothetical protein